MNSGVYTSAQGVVEVLPEKVLDEEAQMGDRQNSSSSFMEG